MARRFGERSNTRAADQFSWYGDPRLWIAILGTLSARLLFMLCWFTVWRDSGWAGHMRHDVDVWEDFWRETQAGKIPYVDFPREYPVCASIVYWAMSPLIHLGDEQNVYLVHLAVMAAIDLVNVALFFAIARIINDRRALVATFLFALNLTAIVLGPLRFESLLVTTLLIGYLLHLKKRTLAATAVWSLGTGIKWYPLFLVAAQEVKIRKWSHLWRAGFVFALVQLLLNGPFLLASLEKNGNIDHWLETYTYHLHRELSADTVLGMAQMWLGTIRWEHYASLISLFLIAAAILVRPSMNLDMKAVLIGVAFLIFNRIYSPQFNLWFYPFLILWMMRLPPRRALGVLVIFCLLDLTNVLAYPFVFTDALLEMHRFGPLRAAKHGGVWTEIWSGSIFLRAGLLFLLAIALLRERRAMLSLTSIELPDEQSKPVAAQ